MGRNSVAGTTSPQNIGEEYRTPKGGTRDVRVRVELSRATTHALSTKEGTTLAQRRPRQSSQDGSLYHPTAPWEFWLYTSGVFRHGCWHTAYRRLSNH